MYRVSFTPDAEADLAHLDRAIAQRVLTKLRWLAENLDAVKPEQLTGGWQNVYKLRVGDYRILYTFDRTDRKIIVLFVRHRSNVYKTGR